jgi:hypothetical protein
VLAQRPLRDLLVLNQHIARCASGSVGPCLQPFLFCGASSFCIWCCKGRCLPCLHPLKLPIAIPYYISSLCRHALMVVLHPCAMRFFRLCVIHFALPCVPMPFPSLQQAAHHALNVEPFQINICLPASHKHDRSPARVDHGQRSADLHRRLDGCVPAWNGDMHSAIEGPQATKLRNRCLHMHLSPTHTPTPSHQWCQTWLIRCHQWACGQ